MFRTSPDLPFKYVKTNDTKKQSTEARLNQRKESELFKFVQTTALTVKKTYYSKMMETKHVTLKKKTLVMIQNTVHAR